MPISLWSEKWKCVLPSRNNSHLTILKGDDPSPLTSLHFWSPYPCKARCTYSHYGSQESEAEMQRLQAEKNVIETSLQKSSDETSVHTSRLQERIDQLEKQTQVMNFGMTWYYLDRSEHIGQQPYNARSDFRWFLTGHHLSLNLCDLVYGNDNVSQSFHIVSIQLTPLCQFMSKVFCAICWISPIC